MARSVFRRIPTSNPMADSPHCITPPSRVGTKCQEKCRSIRNVWYTNRPLKWPTSTKCCVNQDGYWFLTVNQQYNSLTSSTVSCQTHISARIGRWCRHFYPTRRNIWCLKLNRFPLPKVNTYSAEGSASRRIILVSPVNISCFRKYGTPVTHEITT